MNEHLRADKYQQNANARLQMAELVGNGCEQKEHGTQTEDGEDVGKEHDVGVERNGEDRRDAVEGKYQIAELNDQDGDKERGEKPFALAQKGVGRCGAGRICGNGSLADEEFVAHKFRMHTPCLCEETHQRMFLHVDFLLFVAVDIHLHTTIYKECAEEQQHPVEATDDGSTEEDENETENDGTEDAPVEHMLVFFSPHRMT